MSPWIWAIAALLVALSELHAPGSYLIWIGIGAGLTAVVAFVVDLTLGMQIGVFIVAAGLSCVFGHFVYQRMIRSPIVPLMNQRALAMVGAKGIVAKSFEHGRGKVTLGDTVWLAEGPNLTEGTPIIVARMRDTTVVVVLDTYDSANPASS
ncbi:MAG TPA: NfeD family protein [Stellaceae bacterium]|nr:NfeD family protein [Stellaceae bacterium]